jgi:hypothetical protein
MEKTLLVFSCSPCLSASVVGVGLYFGNSPLSSWPNAEAGQRTPT